ncbi:AI-2E family transporter [Clostridium estertheticum]|uniref:AI-2E family transporter n=1 Tax=Clostridium estertheticum TaxID=238834 RepID=UPI001C0BA14C|nr:AI-2E family transporter [Clostridium estertheticum]MBU3072034.1 AI-2E family transporter [Clostridium estertheticum]MBU3162126.1 AI-2E family transporter [Clostridium estertheticum]
MKIDKKLLQYCFYASGTVLLIYIGITIFNDIGAIFSFLSSFIGKIIGLVKPLLMALVIVYLFKPGVKTIENFLQKRNIFKRAAPRRLVGILAIYLLVIAGIAALISGIYIMIGGKLSNNITISNMTEYLTKYLNNPALSVSSITEKLQNSNISMLGNLNDKITKIVGYVQTYFTTSIGVMTDSVLSIGGNIASFFIALVLSIYLIQDSEYFMDLWEKTFNLIFGKSKVGNKLKEILSIIDITFYKYIRGQLLEACIVGVLSAIVLYFVGIDYALIIGIIAGICNMIPYIGPVVGTILAVIIALLSGQPIRAVWAVVGMIVVQEVDNKLLAPKIVGDSVGLHPVFTMLAIIIGGSVWGLIGMMIAVPVAACFKVLISKWYTYHMEKTNN